MNRRQAPSVSYPVGPCVLYQRLLLMAWGLGVLVVSVQTWHTAQAPVGGLLLLALVGALAFWVWRQAPSGQLHWTRSEGWVWQAAGGTTVLPVPVLVWRGRHHLLLQVVSGPRQLRWLWVERWRDPLRWEAMCRAVQAV